MQLKITRTVWEWIIVDNLVSFHSQEGNSPDHQIRPLKITKCKRRKKDIDI